MKYRPDIDGLRAIAVVAVVLDHAGFKWFAGGYIGVDVFFVISGYLITGIISREMEQGRFSIIKFYERRIRRIFPALFVMLAGASALSLWLYRSANLYEYSQSLIATTLFYSNFLFWSQAGYFDAPSLLKPLLHTWSLAVEEQFYIIFPLFLWLLYQKSPNRKAWLVGLTLLVSFILSLYGVYRVEDGRVTAFYLLHMRAWELLAGSLLALKVFPPIHGGKTRNLTAFSGLLTILAPIFLYTDRTVFPGLTAIPPVLGTMMIIWAGMDSPAGQPFVSRLLGLKPIVFIGLISYSLYLWHWPLLVFARYYSITGLGLYETVLILFLIFMMAVLSWQFVEKPFRKHNEISRQRIYAFAATSILTTSLFGFLIYYNKGFEALPYFRLPESPTLPRDFSSIKHCPSLEDIQDLNPAVDVLCKLGAPSQDDAPVEFLLLGDSQARALAYGVDLSAEKYSVSGKLAFYPGCATFLLNPQLDEKKQCKLARQYVKDYIDSHEDIKTVILFGRWDGDQYYMIYPDGGFLREIEATIAWLVENKKRVILVLPTPRLDYDLESSYYIALRTRRDINSVFGLSLDQYTRHIRRFSRFGREMASKYAIEIIEPEMILCRREANICPMVIENNGPVMLYTDNFHLSPWGSIMLSPLFDPVFEHVRAGDNNK